MGICSILFPFELMNVRRCPSIFAGGLFEIKMAQFFMKTRLITLLACAVMAQEVVGQSKTIPLVGLQDSRYGITKGELVGSGGVYRYSPTSGNIENHTYIQRPVDTYELIQNADGSYTRIDDLELIDAIEDVRVLKVPLGMHNLQQIDAESYFNIEEIHLSHDTSFDRLIEWNGYSFVPVSKALHISTNPKKKAKDTNGNQIYKFVPTRSHDGYLEPIEMSVITNVEIYSPVWLKNKITHTTFNQPYAHNDEVFLNILHPELHTKSRTRPIIHWIVYADTENLLDYKVPSAWYRIPLDALERFRRREGKQMFLIPYKHSVSVKQPTIRPPEYISGLLLPGLVRADGTPIVPLPTIITTNKFYFDNEPSVTVVITP